MANAAVYKGLKPIGNRDHDGFGGLQAYYLPAAAANVGIGDIIKKASGLNAKEIYGIPANTIPNASVLTAAAGTGAITGVVVSIAPINPFDKMGEHGKTGRDRVIFVQDSLECEFAITANSAATVTVGTNADIVYAAPDSFTGMSKVSLGASAGTATLPLRVVKVITSPDNDPSQPGAEYVVRINNSSEAPATAGV